VCILSIPNSLNSVLIFVNCYKQPIVSVKQPIVFTSVLPFALCFENWFLNQGFLEVISFKAEKCAKTLFKQFTPL